MIDPDLARDMQEDCHALVTKYKNRFAEAGLPEHFEEDTPVMEAAISTVLQIGITVMSTIWSLAATEQTKEPPAKFIERTTPRLFGELINEARERLGLSAPDSHGVIDAENGYMRLPDPGTHPHQFTQMVGVMLHNILSKLLATTEGKIGVIDMASTSVSAGLVLVHEYLREHEPGFAKLSEEEQSVVLTLIILQAEITGIANRSSKLPINMAAYYHTAIAAKDFLYQHHVPQMLRHNVQGRA